MTQRQGQGGGGALSWDRAASAAVEYAFRPRPPPIRVDSYIPAPSSPIATRVRAETFAQSAIADFSLSLALRPRGAYQVTGARRLDEGTHASQVETAPKPADGSVTVQPGAAAAATPGADMDDGGGAIEADAVDAERFSSTRPQRTAAGRPCEPGAEQRQHPGPTRRQGRMGRQVPSLSSGEESRRSTTRRHARPGRARRCSSRTPLRHSGEGSWLIPAHGGPPGPVRRLQGGAPLPCDPEMNRGTRLHIGRLREGLARDVNQDRKGPLPHRIDTGAAPSLWIR